MDYPCAKFGDCTFIRFGFNVRTNTQTESHTDVVNRYTDATTIGRA